MSVEKKDHLTRFGKTLRIGGLWWIAAAAAGIITSAALAQVILAGGIGSIIGTAIENRKKFIGTLLASSGGSHTTAGHH